MNKLQWKDLFREIKKNSGRYLSLLFIVALGCAFYSGIRSSEPDMTASADRYYDETNFCDIRLVSTLGLTEDDLKAVSNIDGILNAEGSYNVELFALCEEDEPVINVVSLGKDINQFTVKEGRLPQTENECFMDTSYMSRQGLCIGDQITLVNPDKEVPEELSENTFTIVGYGTWAWYLNLTRGSASIGDGSVDAFMVLVPDVFTQDYYSSIYATVEGAMDVNCYEDDYDDIVEMITDKVEGISDIQVKERHDAIVSEGEEKLEDARKEIADAKQELSDAYDELTDGEKEYQDGLKEYEDGLKELEDGKADYAKGLSDYYDGKAQYEDGLTSYEEGKEAYDEGYKEYLDGVDALNEGKKTLEDSKKELDSCWKAYNAGLKEYKDGVNTLKEKENELIEGEKALDAAESNLEEKKSQALETKENLLLQKSDVENQLTSLEENKTQLEGTIDYLKGQLSELISQKEMMEAAGMDTTEIEMGIAQLQASLAEAEAGYGQIEDGLTQLQAGLSQIDGGLSQIEAGLAEIEAGFEQIQEKRSQIEAGKKEIASAKEVLQASKEELSKAKSELTAGDQAYKAGQKEIEKNEKTLDEAKKTLESSAAELESAEQELENARLELLDGKNELDEAAKTISDGEAELADAKNTLDDARSSLDDGWNEYNDGKKEADEKIADAEIKIADGEKELEDLPEGKWYVLTRNEIQTSVEYGMDAERIGKIAQVFPVIFFLVAALVSLTTMTRMIEEERMLIGTMKALGYGKFSIISKYLFYAFSATIIGGTLGVLIGSKILPYVIMTAYGMLYTNVPYRLMPYNLTHCLTAIGFALICTVGAAFAACYRELLSTPAALMRPMAPKQGKKVFLERIPFLWSMLNFSMKSTARNLIRYKKRFFMTVFGIGGCMAILLVSYGLHDSIKAIVDNQYKRIWTYSVYCNIDENLEDEEKIAIREAFEEDEEDISESMLARNISIDVSTAAATKNAYLYVVESKDMMGDFVSLHDRNTKEEYELTEDGVVISEKLGRMLGVSPGDSITLKISDTEYKEVKVTASAENYLYNYIYLTPDFYKSVFGEDVSFNECVMRYSREMAEDEEDALAEKLLSNEGVTSVHLVSELQRTVDNMMNALNLVVWVLVIAAGLLVFVVSFNLNNINISERRRELATLKVLGFYNMEVAIYVYRENVFLTLFGIIAGIFMGTWLHSYVITTLEVEMIMFGRDISLNSYAMSSLLTVIFSVLVNVMMYYKLKQINMVESLKSVE